MATLSEAKAMGGIGSIMVLLVFVPSIGWILGIIGFILTLISIKIISDIVGDHKIFSDMIISVVLAIAALCVGAFTVIAAFFRLMGMGSFVGSTFVLSPNLQPGDWVGFALAVIPGLVAIWVLLILSAVFLRKSYDSMAMRLNIGLFATAALIYLIGAITVIIAIGFLLIIVAEVILAIAFFSIQERPSPAGPQQVA